MIFLTIVAGPAFRAVAVVMDMNPVSRRVLPFGQLDALGLGAGLALLLRANGRINIRSAPWMLAAGLMIVAELLPRQTMIMQIALDAIVPLGWHMLFVAVVYGAAVGFNGWAGRILTVQPVLYVGMISYGIYVFHLLVPDFVKLLNIPIKPRAVSYIAVTLLCATISWYALERPLNSLKRLIPYGSRWCSKSGRGRLH
jgi:peptidoglycan/LPS O-acetylase OafA/YrhL